MTKRRSYQGTSFARQSTKSQEKWWDWLRNPLVLQAVAVLLLVLALLTVLTLLKLTSGRWTDAWVNALQRLFGWGIVPVTTAIAAAGILILRQHLDRPIIWRWRPAVGLELVFFSLLAFTHLLAGKDNPWGLVESGWGGGLVGLAISNILSEYIGSLATGFLLVALLALGIGLTLDMTVGEARRWLSRFRSRRPVVARQDRTPSPLRTDAERPKPSQPHATARAKPSPTHFPQQPTITTTRSATPSKPKTRPAPTTPLVPAEPIPLTAVMHDIEFRLPSIELLDMGEDTQLSDEEVREKSRIITETLSQFGLPVQVVEVRSGPTVTQFGIAPGFTERVGREGRRRSQKVRVSQITALSNDLALSLAAPSLRVEAPVPGRPIVGIEVPNEEISPVTLRSVMESEQFQSMNTPLAIALGLNVAGEPVVADLGLMPHLLIAGTTGSGKSVCIKSLATCLAMNNRPDDLRVIMVDPKMVELVRFNGLPHLLGHTEYELDRVSRVLRWVAHEMDQRFKDFAALGARQLDDYNALVSQRNPEKRRPRIVVIIDELADLMMLAPEQTERTICRIAQMARATGIHLVVATQRPSVDVVTGLIKANFPARVSFATASQVDSRVILDMPGAETLLGRGDMLYLASDAGHPVRVQGCLVSEPEINLIVESWKSQASGWPTDAPWEPMMQGPVEGAAESEWEEQDSLIQDAVELVRKRKTVSASFLQRQLRIGYPRAARLMEHLEEMGLVGPPESAGRPRRVIGGESD